MTLTRRTGEAWDVAQNSAEFAQPGLSGGAGTYAGGVDGSVTLIVRFDSDRQKLTSAVQPPESHWLNTSIAPLIVTSRGDAPSPATVV